MSIDRCLAIWQPLRSLRRRRDRFYVLASWIISLLLSLPQIYIFSLREMGDGVFDCWGDFVQPWGAKAYVTWISLTIYIIPVAIISVCYGLISYKIWQNFKLKTRRNQCLSLTPRPAKGTALSASAASSWSPKLRSGRWKWRLWSSWLILSAGRRFSSFRCGQPGIQWLQEKVRWNSVDQQVIKCVKHMCIK